MPKVIRRKLSGAKTSWTIWFNSFVAAFGVVASSTDALKGIVPERYFPLVFTFIAAINVGLRFRTSTALEDK
jgi:hypothetical protein